MSNTAAGCNSCHYYYDIVEDIEDTVGDTPRQCATAVLDMQIHPSTPEAC